MCPGHHRGKEDSGVSSRPQASPACNINLTNRFKLLLIVLTAPTDISPSRISTARITNYIHDTLIPVPRYIWPWSTYKKILKVIRYKVILKTRDSVPPKISPRQRGRVGICICFEGIASITGLREHD